MRYASFRFQNFKGITDLTVRLNKPPSADVFTLVGLNESGKTTVLEAIEFFAGALDQEVDSAAALDLPGAGVIDLRDTIPIALAADFTGTVSVEATVDLNDQDVDNIRDELAEQHDFVLEHLESTLTIKRAVRFEHSIKKSTNSVWDFDFRGRTGDETVENPPAKHPIWQATLESIRKRLPAIWYFPNFLIDLPDRIYLTGPKATERKNAFYNRLMQDVLDAQARGLDLEEHVSKRLLSPDDKARRTAEQLLLKLSRDLTERVFAAWQQVLNRPRTETRVKISSSTENGNHLFLEFSLEEPDGLFRVSERSLGFRWFFGFLFLTHYRTLRRGATRPVFLLDEPASNLHSSAQLELMRSFDKLSKAATVIYSTHSHHLINPDWLGSLFVVKNGALNYETIDDGATSKDAAISVEGYRSFVASHPDQTTYFQPVLDVLEYRPSHLENVPNVVMVEGKTDYYVVRFAAALLDGKSVGILPGGGAGTLDRAIQLYVAWGRNFVVLLDGDAEGERQRRRYTDKFGAVLRGRLFTLKNVDNQWADIESLFDQADALRIQSVACPGLAAVKKKQFHLGIQECVARSLRPEVTAATRDRLEEVLGYLLNRLDEAEQVMHAG